MAVDTRASAITASPLSIALYTLYGPAVVAAACVGLAVGGLILRRFEIIVCWSEGGSVEEQLVVGLLANAACSDAVLAGCLLLTTAMVMFARFVRNHRSDSEAVRLEAGRLCERAQEVVIAFSHFGVIVDFFFEDTRENRALTVWTPSGLAHLLACVESQRAIRALSATYFGSVHASLYTRCLVRLMSGATSYKPISVVVWVAASVGYTGLLWSPIVLLILGAQLGIEAVVAGAPAVIIWCTAVVGVFSLVLLVGTVHPLVPPYVVTCRGVLVPATGKVEITWDEMRVGQQVEERESEVDERSAPGDKREWVRLVAMEMDGRRPPPCPCWPIAWLLWHYKSKQVD